MRPVRLPGASDRHLVLHPPPANVTGIPPGNSPASVSVRGVWINQGIGAPDDRSVRETGEAAELAGAGLDHFTSRFPCDVAVAKGQIAARRVARGEAGG